MLELGRKELQHFAENFSNIKYRSDPFEADGDLDKDYDTVLMYKI